MVKEEKMNLHTNLDLTLFRWVRGAVLGISADSATFFPGLFRILGWVGELFCGFQRFQLLFYGFFRLFRCGLGSCFVDFSGFSYFFPEFFQLLGWIGELF